MLCNCEIKADNHFLLESLAACQDTKSKLIMYFMVNTAFINYLNNLTTSLKVPILLNETTLQQTLPMSLQPFNFNSDLLKSPKTLKDFVHQFQHKKEIFDFQKRHNDDLDLAKKNCFFSIYYCHYCVSGYFNSFIHNMQTYKIKLDNSLQQDQF